MSTSASAHGEITFSPPIAVAVDETVPVDAAPIDLQLHPDYQPGHRWAWLALAESGDGTFGSLKVDVDDEYGVSSVVFEVDAFAAAHPELSFAGHFEYDDDSGHQGERYRITVLRRKGRNRTYLSRPDYDGRWPDPGAGGRRVRQNRWPKGW